METYKIGSGNSDIPFNPLARFLEIAMEYPHAETRKKAVEITKSLFNYRPDVLEVMKIPEGVKKTLKSDIREIYGVGEPEKGPVRVFPSKNDDKTKTMAKSSKSPKSNKATKKKAPGGNKSVQEYEEIDARGADSLEEAEAISYPEMDDFNEMDYDVQTIGDEDFTCQICGMTKENYTEEMLDHHIINECPALTNCKECNQIVEISFLDEHLLSECSSAAKYTKCKKCHKAVLRREYKPHIRDPKKCTTYFTCPLCVNRIKSGENGLLAHLVDGKCPKNPRTAKKRRG